MGLEGLRVVVDVQHLYRWNKPNDRGSLFTLENGTHVWEADAALIYADALADRLEAQGVPVFRNDPIRGLMVGPYQTRNNAGSAWGATAYLACHLNAGRGAYALLEVMEGRDDRLAQAIGERLVAIPELTRYERRWLKQEDRGSVCIRFVKETIPTVLCEPFFGDQPAHQPLLAFGRLRELGETMALGVEDWWKTRTLPA